MARPRVLHVYKDVFPPIQGGIERTIYHLGRLTAGAYEPVVLVAARGLRGRRRVVAAGFEVVEVGSLGRWLSTPVAPGFLPAMKRLRPDLLHFHAPHPTGEIAYVASGLKIPAVVTYHSDIVRQRQAVKFYGPLLKAFLRRARVIMPTSERYLSTSPYLAPVADRCRVVPLGIPLEDYELDEARGGLAEEFRRRWGRFILFLGVLRYYKGLPVLLRAMEGLAEARLVVAGDGPEGPALRRLAGELGLDERVAFLGSVDQATAVALLHAASVFCLPATERAEAFGLCQIEAMACGLPVVSTDLPTGVPEVNRHGLTGLIVPPQDASALATALGRLLADPEQARRLGEAGRRRAGECYTARLMAERVAAIYDEVLAARASLPQRGANRN